MEHALAGPMLGRTRWRRAWVVLAPALVIVAILLVFIARGLIAVSFAVSGTAFTVTADQVASNGTDANGVGFYQFGVADFAGNGTPIPQAENIIPSATITNLCQSVQVGPLTLRITAGTGATPVSATNLIIDATSLSASSAHFTNINIGQDMGTYSSPALTEPAARGSGPNVTTAAVPTGTFGQVASAVSLNGVRQLANATQASSFTLPNLSLGFGAAC
jgi:uncharacterized protein DUF6230